MIDTNASPLAEAVRERTDDADNALPTFVVGVVAYATLGALFVAGMHAANFQGETAILMLMAGVLFIIAIIVPVFRLRANLPVYVLFPFCSYVNGNFCGDMGKVHMFDAIPFSLATLLLFVVISSSSIWKLFRRFRA